MGRNFTHFTDHIPENIIREVEKYIASKIALFKPTIFLLEPLQAVDFHIIIPNTTPPDAYINGQLKSFERGKMVILNPGETMVCTASPPTGPYYSLLIKPDLINRVAREMGCSDGARFLRLINPFSLEIIQAIKRFDQETKHPESFTLMLDCMGIQISALLLRELKTNLKKYPVHSPDHKAYVNIAIDYMQTFYSANISIHDICREINVSPFHFIRSFKKKTGLTPHQYLLNVRIQKAQELLKSGQYSVSETAELCGFVSLPHFSNIFKKITGRSPSAYRKFFLLT